ncbi:hypothetical protein [Egbenema bharatensis]|uniref:hypothetical protein n=1 Tax=Egbenema bharatensis TaxID=3463334 RepID=UPI003A8C79BD
MSNFLFPRIEQRLFNPIRSLATKRPIAATSLFIFITCIFVYLINNRTDLDSSDNVTNTLLAFNWLENHALNFDAFREGYLYQGGGIPYYFIESPTGHLSSRYPIGTALVTFPLYVLFFIYLKIASLVEWVISGVPATLPDVTGSEFAAYRRSFSKLAATLSTALTVVIFYGCVRLKFRPGVALLSTFVFAFATGTWVICSQDLRQHTISNLLLISIVFCLIKLERSQGQKRKALLWAAGFFCGLFPGVRITSALFAVAIVVYVIFTYRKEAIFFIFGLPSALFSLGWNLYYFGWENILVGGYIKHLEERASSYAFTLEQFTSASLGLLISPSDGLLIYSPVLLFAIPGAYLVFKRRANRDEALMLCLAITCFALYLHYCFYIFWLGGNDSFGSRMLTDTLPISGLLIAYFLANLAEKLDRASKFARPILSVFLLSLILSTLIQTVGAFTQTSWGASPIPLGADRSRLWQLADSKIERHLRHLIAQINPPISDRDHYLENFQGTVKQIELESRSGEREPVGDRLTVRAGQRRLLRVGLKNTGQSQWFGYQTGIGDRGETKLRIRFYDSDDQNATLRVGNQLYVSGSPTLGEETDAMGQVAFPREAGDYRLIFQLFADGLSPSSNEAIEPIYTQLVTVLPRES